MPTHRADSRPPSGDTQAPATALDELLSDEREALKQLFPLPGGASQARKKPRRKEQVAAAIGGSLLLAVLAVLDPPYAEERFQTAVGEQRTVTLADGSRITLDTASALRVSWHLRSRRSVLEQGRASFAIAPMVIRPFEVDAGRFSVQVVGTIFDVVRSPEQSSVTLSEGAVQVTSIDGGTSRLAPGQRLSARNGSAAQTGQVDLERESAWREGRLVFDHTPLGEALAEIARYRSQPVRLHGEHLAALEVSGVFDTANTDQALSLLPRILPLRVSPQADGSVDISPR